MEAATAAREIGLPVVLKASGFAHKSEHGALMLDLRSADEVENAALKMPSKDLLVEEMITGSVAELLIGVVCDPAHGYVLTLAAGGTLTELVKDRACLLLPVGREDIAAALARLKIHPLLAGYRGKPACDLEAIIDAVMCVQAYVSASNAVEVEINPLICGTNFAVAADALIRAGDAHERRTD